MYETVSNSNATNVRSLITLTIVAVSTLAVVILCSPAVGLYELGPAQKQIAASGR
ncbi:hypothetical protein [Paramagnetospirillum magneticum]|uniref:Uncharacterized protein n=1 Tax=Paramagnetospirillum magneticum (strain ATCC 700264 / AMB-1) TaxID=342108 RepID=Q2W6P6_PARM1|nr:hypothetical protein [Paramagnetospirillum magneticum]BAE50479.1 hypothetical protein amb1675 [Paramagnetospirillum magneticum AMB-1]